MTVVQLIKELEKMEQDSEVRFTDGIGEEYIDNVDYIGGVVWLESPSDDD